MTDGELQHLARDPESLTEAAWETLEEELDRRNLELPTHTFDPEPELDLRTLVTIRQFRDLPEALLAKGSLESAASNVSCATTISFGSTGSFQILSGA